MFTHLQGLKALGIPLGPRRALVIRYGRPADASRGLLQPDNQLVRTISSSTAVAGQFGRTSSGVSVGANGVTARMEGGGQPMAVDELAEISRAVQFANVSCSSKISPSGRGFEGMESGSKRAFRIDVDDFGSEVNTPALSLPLTRVNI